MNNMDIHKRNCASCGLHNPRTASDHLHEHLRQILDVGGHHQRSLPAHSSDYIEGTWASCRKISGFILAELQHQGVDRETLKKISLRRAKIVWCGVQRFEFESKGHSPWMCEGEQALLILVRDAFGRAVDIVAWDPKTNRLGSWLGGAFALGQGLIFAARLSDGLLVHRTPLEWLCAGGKGIVIFNYSMARSYLADAGPLVVENRKHRRDLEAALAHPLPRILIVPAATASEVAR
jgi:hypothetical protein